MILHNSMIHKTFLQTFVKLKLPLAVLQQLPSLLPFLNLPDQPSSTKKRKKTLIHVLIILKKHPFSVLSHYLIFNNQNQTCSQNLILVKNLKIFYLKQLCSYFEKFFCLTHSQRVYDWFLSGKLIGLFLVGNESDCWKLRLSDARNQTLRSKCRFRLVNFEECFMRKKSLILLIKIQKSKDSVQKSYKGYLQSEKWSSQVHVRMLQEDN